MEPELSSGMQEPETDIIWDHFLQLGTIFFYVCKWVFFFAWLLGLISILYIALNGGMEGLSSNQTSGLGFMLIKFAFMCYILPFLKPSFEAWSILIASTLLVVVALFIYGISLSMQGSLFLVSMYIISLFTFVGLLLFTFAFSLAYLEMRKEENSELV